MVTAAEKLGGPYRWGRYDVLVLPPSFPFGGMENPRLTFATPTVLAGDRSLMSLVAHELAHSWSGNLVTNATWSDFWLNEGFTTYFENRIMEALYGPDRAAMLAVARPARTARRDGGLGGHAPATRSCTSTWTGAIRTMRRHAWRTRRARRLLRIVEQTVGRERFDAWLRRLFRPPRVHVDHDRGVPRPTSARTCSTATPRSRRRCSARSGSSSPGCPPTRRCRARKRSRGSRRKRERSRGHPAAVAETSGWTHAAVAALPRHAAGALTRAQLRDLDRAFGFSQTGNSEILFAWLRIAIRTTTRRRCRRSSSSSPRRGGGSSCGRSTRT